MSLPDIVAAICYCNIVGAIGGYLLGLFHSRPTRKAQRARARRTGA